MNQMANITADTIRDLEEQLAAQKKEIAELRQELQELKGAGSVPTRQSSRDFFQLFQELSVREYESRFRLT